MYTIVTPGKHVHNNLIEVYPYTEDKGKRDGHGNKGSYDKKYLSQKKT